MSLPVGGGHDAGAEDQPPVKKEVDLNDSRIVGTLAKGLMILDAFGSNDEFLGNHVICERTGLQAPTVSRLVHTLIVYGYLERVPRLRKVRIGNSPLALARTKLSRMQFRDRARLLMQEVVDGVGGVLFLGGAAGLEMVCLEGVRGEDTVTISLEVGSRVPMATSAMGRAYLAALSDAERVETCRLLKTHYGRDWSTIESEIDDAIAQIRTTGFCMSEGHWKRDVSAVGVPYVDARTGTVFGFTCGAPHYLMSRNSLETEVGPALMAMVDKLKQQNVIS